MGCGRLAGIVSDAVVKGLLPEYELVGVYSRTTAKSERIAAQMQRAGKACAVCLSTEELLALKPDVLVERFYRAVSAAARESGARIYLASGATGGFDVLRTVSLMGGASARFFNEKGPDALKGTPVYDDSLQAEQRVVFSGNAAEAISLFPTKVNVTVAASRASVGPEAMQVTIRSTPGFKGDTQRVEIENEQVRAVVDVYSATAEIAGWSVVNTLLNIVSPVVF